MSAVPFFSIITATRNAENILGTLLKSLVCQSCRDFEVLIQDGASGDGTVGLARCFESRLPVLSVHSESDTGIYDAWNKAVSRARGEWVLFLGADDCLHDADSLADVKEWLGEAAETVSYAACSLLLTTQAGSPVETLRPSTAMHDGLASSMPLPHPALFHRKKLFKFSLFSTDYKIAGDYEFLCRTLTRDNAIRSDMVISRMCVGGVSGSLDSMLQGELESLAISRRYFPRAFRVKLYARICRSLLVRTINFVAGKRTAHAFADTARKVSGQTALWTRNDASPVVFSALPKHPAVSLLVATLGRKEPLRRLFISLNEQEYRNFEILIADQNPSGFLDDIIRVLDPDISVTHVLLQEKGLSRARNTLLPMANGDIIAFPDDDCWYTSDTLARIQETFKENPHMGGLVASWDEECKQGAAITLTPVTRFNVFQRAGTHVQFYRNEVLRELKFDPILGPGTGFPYGCGEDTDFILQALDNGIVVYRSSEILVCHPLPDVQSQKMVHKTAAYARGRMLLLRKHNFPLYFKVLNILYPLGCMALEAPKYWKYRKTMFFERLKAFLWE